MRRTSLCVAALLILAIMLLAAPDLLSPHSVSWADVGELPETGGLVTPGDKTDEIRMKSERVVFSVRPDDGTFEAEGAEYYAHVTADFVMHNLTSKVVSKDLFFPFHSSMDLAGFRDPANAWARQAKNAKVMVAGQEVQVSYTELTLSTQEQVMAGAFPVSFPAGEEIAIQIQYDVRAVNEPKSPLLSFDYLMETGSHWAGTIGSGEVRFEFPRPVESKAVFGSLNDFFQVADGDLVWQFSELEPDPSHNITVTFDPAQFSRVEGATAVAAPNLLTVRAFVDGRSRLVVQGDRAYWHHLDFAAPGRWSDPDYTQPHDEPTYLNGVAWYPIWPDRPDRENRDCDCDSSETSGLPPLAQISQTVTLDVEQGRSLVTIVRQPEAGNDYTLIVEFDDDGEDGADWYEVTIHYEVRLIVGPPAEASGDCTGPNLLRNGDFEGGFDGRGVGLSWQAFHAKGGAAYGFQDDRWSPVVYEGLHSQLIAIGSDGTCAADRFAGIYQTVAGLEPGAVYELSIAGLLREEAAHPGEDPYRYQVQWAFAAGVPDWTQVAAWQNLPWDTYSLRTEPGAFSIYTARLVAPGESVTLFIRAWKKWATSGRELDVNLDGIALRLASCAAP